MRDIEGTATISIAELDKLRQREEWFSELKRNVRGLIERIDDEEYEKRAKHIDDMEDLADEELESLITEAKEELKIIVSEKALRKLIHEYIDGAKKESYYILQEMTEEEFAKVPLILDSMPQERSFPKLEDLKQTGGQQDKTVCEMCEAYMTDTVCDMKDYCPAAHIIKRLKDAEQTIKEKEKIIADRDKTIHKLKTKPSDLKLNMSYMTDPMTIGDRHEMGG